MGALVDIDVSSFIAFGRSILRSTLLDSIGGLGTRRGLTFGLPGLGGLGSLTGDSSSNRGSSGASVYSHGDYEGGSSSENECL